MVETLQRRQIDIHSMLLPDLEAATQRACLRAAGAYLVRARGECGALRAGVEVAGHERRHCFGAAPISIDRRPSFPKAAVRGPPLLKASHAPHWFKIALARPHAIVVMAVLLLIFGVSAAIRTPVDIFPSINVPVISAVFSYGGLSPDDMSGRIVTYYERALTTSVNDVEHIESQSLPNYGIIKIYFQPTVNINAAMAQVTAVSQTVLKQMPQGITPPTILSYDAASVPILQLALSSKNLPDTTLFDQASSFIRPQLASVAGAAIPLPYGGKVKQVQADLNPQALAQ